jgi:hypothetical protein
MTAIANIKGFSLLSGLSYTRQIYNNSLFKKNSKAITVKNSTLKF